MDRLACVDLPALPLQILLREHPEWSTLPAAVVNQDSPQGILLWVNPRARGQRILPGQRYAAALSIDAGLRVGVVDELSIEKSVEHLARLLHDFSPEVEPSREMPGVFWLDASGLGRLQPSLKRWADSIRLDLHHLSFHANVAVGFHRFATYALVKNTHGSIVFDDGTAEMTAAHRVTIDKLDFDPDVRETLAKLGAVTLGDFLDLPAAGIRRRFGARAHALHRLAAGRTWAPLLPRAPVEPIEECFFFEEPVCDISSLLFVLKQLVETMLTRLAVNTRALARLIVLLREDLPGHSPLDGAGALVGDHAETDAAAGWRCEQLQPASPTLDAALLVDLVRLRLRSTNLQHGILEVRLRAVDVAATGEQLRMFPDHPHRDLDAGARALARIRAELGEDTVVKAVLREGHLPEARFAWIRLDKLTAARPRNVRIRPLVRRLLARPEALSPQSKEVRNDDWMLCDLEQGSVVGVAGPYVVSGGWWVSPIHREYHYIETERGDYLWAYYDGRRRRWFLHGRVE